MAETSDLSDAGYAQLLGSINRPKDSDFLPSETKARIGRLRLSGAVPPVARAPLAAEEEASLRRGLAQSAAGQTVGLGDFTQYTV